MNIYSPNLQTTGQPSPGLLIPWIQMADEDSSALGPSLKHKDIAVLVRNLKIDLATTVAGLNQEIPFA
jgi:hypothetical protein